MKLYVGNLGESTTAEDLRPLFEAYGLVRECEVLKQYAFVHMDDEQEAGNAVDQLNGTSVKGRYIKVQKSSNNHPSTSARPNKATSIKLFVGNLAEGTSNEDLVELFSNHAPVIEADVIKNFGFVHIDADNPRTRVNEILRELNGYVLKGNKIRVQQSTSDVRHKPGMGGDTCYRCGKDGHWSKECPTFPDPKPVGPIDRRMGGGAVGSRGFNGPGRSSGPMRGGSFGGSRNAMGGGSGGSFRGEPYPPPPPPSYMRERMNEYDYRGGNGMANAGGMRGGNNGNYGGGYQGYPGNAGVSGGFDGFVNRRDAGYHNNQNYDLYGGGNMMNNVGMRGNDMYDRRNDGYSFRDIGRGPGPMPSNDVYNRDPFFQGTVGGGGYSTQGYSSNGGGYLGSGPGFQPSGGYSTGGGGGGYGCVISTNTGSGGDPFARRNSPSGGYGPNRGAGGPRGYQGGGPIQNNGGGFGMHSRCGSGNGGNGGGYRY